VQDANPLVMVKRQRNASITRLKRRLEPWLFLLPLLLVFALVAYPLLSSIWLSLTDKRVGMSPTFIGFENYRALISDPVFRKAAMNSIIYTVAGVSAKLLLGLVTALVVNERFPLRNVVRGIVALPWVIPTVVTVLIWFWMFNELTGVLNLSLRQVGLAPVPWLSRRWPALISVIIVNVWRGSAFFGINLLAGMQSINPELYEAAHVDGANTIQCFRHVTIPGLRNVLFVTTILSTIWTLNDFQIVHILTRGGPGTATQVFATLTYEIGIASLQLGRGIAVGLVLFPVILVAIIFFVRQIGQEQ
jgi:multiple sugar transport system permease protein